MIRILLSIICFTTYAFYVWFHITTHGAKKGIKYVIIHTLFCTALFIGILTVIGTI